MGTCSFCTARYSRQAHRSSTHEEGLPGACALGQGLLCLVRALPGHRLGLKGLDLSLGLLTSQTAVFQGLCDNEKMTPRRPG